MESTMCVFETSWAHSMDQQQRSGLCSWSGLRRFYGRLHMLTHFDRVFESIQNGYSPNRATKLPTESSTTSLICKDSYLSTFPHHSIFGTNANKLKIMSHIWHSTGLASGSMFFFQRMREYSVMRDSWGTSGTPMDWANWLAPSDVRNTWLVWNRDESSHLLNKSINYYKNYLYSFCTECIFRITN